MCTFCYILGYGDVLFFIYINGGSSRGKNKAKKIESRCFLKVRKPNKIPEIYRPALTLTFLNNPSRGGKM